MTYLALTLAKQEISTFWIGLLTTCYYIGLLCGAKTGYYLIRSVGHIRSFAASTAMVIACVAAHGVSDNLMLWLILRFTVGACMMANYMVLESWLNEQASHEKRGQVFSVYMITSYLGTVLGQVALSHFPELGLAPLFLICIAVSLGIVPIAITRRIHPKPLKPLAVGFFSYFKSIPQSLTSVLFAGVISGSFYGLAPIFANDAGFDASGIATFMSMTIFAGLISQWPMGFLSDRIRRSILLRTNAVALVVITAALGFLPLSQSVILVLSFLFGIFAFTLYPLSSALANSRVSDEERVGVSSALLVAFGAGAGVGSTLLAQLMEYFGSSALYGSMSVIAVVMFVLLTTINKHQKKERPKHSDYVVSGSGITASPLAAAMDPRIDESTAQEQLMVTDDDTSDVADKI